MQTIVYSILFVTFCTAVVGAFLLTRPVTPPAKARTWRVTQIPQSITLENLRSQFEELINKEVSARSKQRKSILQLDIAPSIRRYACAIITVCYPLPEITSHGYRIDDTFLGITPLYCSDDPNVDIIAVPGLGSYALGSFKSNRGFEVWLRDFLPKDIPNIRVLLYGYDTKLAESNSRSSIRDLSKSLFYSSVSIRHRHGRSTDHLHRS